MCNRLNKNKGFFSKSCVLKKSGAPDSISELTFCVAVNLCLAPMLGRQGKTPQRLRFELRSTQLFFERDSMELKQCNRWDGPSA